MARRSCHMVEVGSGYLIDPVAFELHMRQIRGQRGDPIPPEWYERPYYYTLCIEPQKMRWDGQTIRFPSWVKKKDYEFEIVGRHMVPIQTTDLAEAIRHVQEHMAFCIFSDTSCRDIQADDRALSLSVSASKGIADKAFGDECVLGKYLNMDENGVFDIPMELSVNGEVRCESNYNSIYFIDPVSGERRNWSFAQMIVWLGRMGQGCQAGHLMGSGTIGDGCIAEYSDKYPWLKHGDEIIMRAGLLGELRNTVEVIEMPDPKSFYRK